MISCFEFHMFSYSNIYQVGFKRGKREKLQYREALPMNKELTPDQEVGRLCAYG